MSRYLPHRLPYTAVTIALAIVVTVLAIFWHIDVFDLPGFSLVGLEHSESGEVAIAFLMVIPAFFVDRAVSRERVHDARLQAEQLRVVHVTIRTVQDIVNNNLNQLQLLRIEAEGSVSSETLELFDAAIHDTAAQLTALGNIEVFAEKAMESGSGLHVPLSNGKTGPSLR
jgi:hypothetical protein